jgi:hypothetical protein
VLKILGGQPSGKIGDADIYKPLTYVGGFIFVSYCRGEHLSPKIHKEKGS